MKNLTKDKFSESSLASKIENFRYLDTGTGLKNASWQSKIAYNWTVANKNKIGLSKAARGIQTSDVAIPAIRNILYLISVYYGDITKEDMDYTNDYLEYRCPYTGKDLRESIKNHSNDIVLDHIVPQNREFCGLNVKGNLVWVDKKANECKGKQSFEDFLRTDTKIIVGTPEDREQRIKKSKISKKHADIIPKK